MKLSDVQKRLQAPFPGHMVQWRPCRFSHSDTRALLLCHIDARAVMDRLDAICPDNWEFTAVEVPTPTGAVVRGALTVLGITRGDMGEGASYKGATSDALKRCAIQFGIGRYLYDLPRYWCDWDKDNGHPVNPPELPEWALPEHERSPGGAHILMTLDMLRHELPTALDTQRAVYNHLKEALRECDPSYRPAVPAPAQGVPADAPYDQLKGALQGLHPKERPEEGAPRPQDAQGAPSDAPTGPEAAQAPAGAPQPAQRPNGATSKQMGDLGQHAQRAGIEPGDSTRRSWLWGTILGLTDPVGTHDLTKAQAAHIIKTCSKLDDETMRATLMTATNIFDDGLPF